jgi:hypothetical protein
VGLSLPQDATGAISAEAVRNLRFLVSGKREPVLRPSRHEPPITYDALALAVIVTAGDSIHLTCEDERDLSGILAPGGEPLLLVRPGERIPISSFLERLDTLRRLWRESGSS